MAATAERICVLRPSSRCKCQTLTACPSLSHPSSSFPPPSAFCGSEEITAASIVQFARSRALPLLAKYIQESRFRYAEAGLPAGTVFLYEDEAGYAQYLNTSRATFLKIAKALRGKVSMYELDDLGGSDMKEYGLAPYMRPAFGIVTQMNDWVSPRRAQTGPRTLSRAPLQIALVLCSRQPFADIPPSPPPRHPYFANPSDVPPTPPRYGFYDNTSLPLVSPGHEDQVVEWALDALAGKVDRDHKSNPVPFEHPFEPIQEIVARNWKKRVLNERNFSLMLTYHLGMQERMVRTARLSCRKLAPRSRLLRGCGGMHEGR